MTARAARAARRDHDTGRTLKRLVLADKIQSVESAQRAARLNASYRDDPHGRLARGRGDIKPARDAYWARMNIAGERFR